MTILQFRFPLHNIRNPAQTNAMTAAPTEHQREKKNLQKLWGWVFGLYLVALIAGNDTTYTDGILQLTVFENHAGIYPPLYGGLTWLLGTVILGALPPIKVAALVSWAAVVFVFWHGIWPFAAKLAGYRVAFLSALLFLLCPLVFRWSSLAMSDALYMALSTGAMFSMVEAWVRLRTEDRTASARKLAWAVAFGGLATLTRYQGVLLAPLLALVFILYVRRFRGMPKLAIAAGLIWLLVPAWMWYNGFVHQDQFAARTTGNWITSFTAWLNTFESFILISPYYFGYPIVAAAIAGVFYVKRIAAPWYPRPAAILWGAYALMILVLQARFGSFQYRYMLPLVPMVCVLAGVGFRWLEDSFAHKAWLPRWALIISVIYLAFFSLCVLFLQGRPFRDQYAAAEWIKENIPADTPVYSNERYGNFTDLGSVKLSYWAERPVNLLPPDLSLAPGAVLVLGTAYGGNEAVGATMEALTARYDLQPVTSQPFRSRVIPLLDDVMVNPMFNQNPMGWVMRYVPQEFATQIFRVTPRPTPAGAANAN